MVSAVVLAAGVLPPAAHAGDGEPAWAESAVLRWDEAGVRAVTHAGMTPPIAARALAVLHTCTYDAWAAYDEVAAGTRFGAGLRRPVQERTAENKSEAVSYAAYTAAVDLWPDSKPEFDALMAELGYPLPGSTGASQVGLRACGAVLHYRHRDGSNQLGELAGGAYSDYTRYRPVNRPMKIGEPLRRRGVKDPDRWQPLIYAGKDGHTAVQDFAAPHWYRVRPFALRSWNQFNDRIKPARYGTREYVRQAWDLVMIGANLDDRQKAIADYWTHDGRTYAPSAVWMRNGQYVARRDRHTVDQDAKLFFALANANFDASIAAWGFKRHYDSVRPVTAIRYLFRNKRIPSWQRVGDRPKMIDGATWHPYHPAWFPTPPFAEFPSGHSTFGAASAEVLRSFTGSDHYGEAVTIAAGSSDVEPGVGPQTDVTLAWPTFSAAADESGWARRLNGVHFENGDLKGRSLGRRVGAHVWAKAAQYFAGTVRPW